MILHSLGKPQIQSAVPFCEFDEPPVPISVVSLFLHEHVQLFEIMFNLLQLELFTIGSEKLQLTLHLR